MSNWTLIIYCGLITYLTRFTMIALIKKEMFNDKIREILSFVPSAIFPAIIFPAIFINETGLFQIEENPKILAAIIAMVIGILSRSIIATIFSGLASYWFLIFVV
ncbi:AzlD domain-containing protein [Pelagibacterales bacterium SAG-MED12]|nr:AzlD domain-containing protein [Pelagibacterales bacterium SAG-MED12]